MAKWRTKASWHGNFKWNALGTWKRLPSKEVERNSVPLGHVPKLSQGELVWHSIGILAKHVLNADWAKPAKWFQMSPNDSFQPITTSKIVTVSCLIYIYIPSFCVICSRITTVLWFVNVVNVYGKERRRNPPLWKIGNSRITNATSLCPTFTLTFIRLWHAPTST